MTKAALRRAALQARAVGGDDAALDARLSRELAHYQGSVLAIYWPMRGEADPRSAAARHDGPVCLPVVVARNEALAFRRWQGEALEGGPFGTLHPAPSAKLMRPGVLIVPLVGFDRSGNRIGYGGGFYDRTLQALRQAGPLTAIGLAYAVQELDLIPAEPFDQPLDLIVTDRETIRPLNAPSP